MQNRTGRLGMKKAAGESGLGAAFWLGLEIGGLSHYEFADFVSGLNYVDAGVDCHAEV